MQSGMKVKPFGLDRLRVVDWIHSLIIFKDNTLGAQMQRLGFPTLLLDLLPQYPMNSFLHLRVNKIFEDAFKTLDELYIKAV